MKLRVGHNGMMLLVVVMFDRCQTRGNKHAHEIANCESGLRVRICKPHLFEN